VFTPALSNDVVRVEWYFDGTLSATATTSPFSYSLNLVSMAGSHTLSARAYDAAGNAATSAGMIVQK
jgi:hypothetical protein